jgi:fatty-acyl-CoA synthase
MTVDVGAGNLWDVFRRALVLHADRTALICGDGMLTYADLGRAVGHVGDLLRAAGAGRGERVLMLLGNGPAFAATDIAITAIGAVKVPLNAMLSPPEVAAAADRVAPVCVVIDDDLAGLATLLPPSVLRVSLGVGWSEAVPAQRDLDPGHDLGADAPAAVYMSGGTTGKPKGIMHSQRSVMQNFWTHLIEAGIARDDRLLVTTPMAHSAGLFTATALVRGAEVVIEPGFDADRWVDLVDRWNVTWSYGVPTMVRRIVDAARRREWTNRSLRTFQYGSAPMSPGLLGEAIDLFGPVLQQLYAQTECPQFATLLRKEDHVRALAEPALLSSVGRAVTMCDVSVRTEDGAECPTGEVGEVCLRSPYVMTGYWGDDAGYRARFHETWLRTGDVGRMDGQGYLYLVDRLADMIISGGMNVYSVEVEAALSTHAAVAQAAVVGLPHNDWGEAVHALVVLDSAHDPGDVAALEKSLADHCRALLAAYKRPKTYEITDAIPTTVYGKYDKKRIRSDRA